MRCAKILPYALAMFVCYNSIVQPALAKPAQGKKSATSKVKTVKAQHFGETSVIHAPDCGIYGDHRKLSFDFNTGSSRRTGRVQIDLKSENYVSLIVNLAPGLMYIGNPFFTRTYQACLGTMEDIKRDSRRAWAKLSLWDLDGDQLPEIVLQYGCECKTCSNDYKLQILKVDNDQKLRSIFSDSSVSVLKHRFKDANNDGHPDLCIKTGDKISETCHDLYSLRHPRTENWSGILNVK